MIRFAVDVDRADLVAPAESAPRRRALRPPAGCRRRRPRPSVTAPDRFAAVGRPPRTRSARAGSSAPSSSSAARSLSGTRSSQPGQPLGVVDRRRSPRTRSPAGPAGTARVVTSSGSTGPPSAPARPQLRARLKPLLGEIGLGLTITSPRMPCGRATTPTSTMSSQSAHGHALDRPTRRPSSARRSAARTSRMSRLTRACRRLPPPSPAACAAPPRCGPAGR